MSHRFPVFLCLLLLATPLLAEPPAGYYDSVDLSSSEALRASLHDVIDGHTKIPYTSSMTDTWDVLNSADEDPLDPTRILDIYRNRSTIKYSGGNNYYNREHVWPNSYGFPDDGSTNLPYTDCHHLFLCNISYNSYRGSRIFDDCETGCSSYATDDYNGQSGVNLSKDASPIGIWETWDGRKGDVARACFYMDVRYEGDAGSEPDLILTDDADLILSCQTGSNETVGYMGLLTTLLEWHEADPVDDLERTRNDRVYAYQDNRNPFIDHPEWVHDIFVEMVSDAPEMAAEGPRITGVWPNPFNPSTTIAASTPADGRVRVEIVTVAGRVLRVLMDEQRAAGNFELRWDGRDERGALASSGAYLCRVEAGGEIDSRTLLLLK